MLPPARPEEKEKSKACPKIFNRRDCRSCNLYFQLTRGYIARAKETALSMKYDPPSSLEEPYPENSVSLLGVVGRCNCVPSDGCSDIHGAKCTDQTKTKFSIYARPVKGSSINLSSVAVITWPGMEGPFRRCPRGSGLLSTYLLAGDLDTNLPYRT